MKKIFYVVLISLSLIFCNVVEARETYVKMQCGDSEIPYVAAQLTHTAINVLQVATPIIIIIFGSIDFLKAVIAQKEDEIKKNQMTFVRRLITGACVFLVFVIVKVVIGLVAPVNENKEMWNCIDCFVNGECETLVINDSSESGTSGNTGGGIDNNKPSKPGFDYDYMD